MTNFPNLPPESFPPEFERELLRMGLSPDDILRRQKEALDRAREAITGRQSSIEALGRVNDLYKRYQAGERNFSEVDLSGCQHLNRCNLSGADLTDANLSSTGLTYANLSHTNLKGVDLSNAELAWANLASANLTHAKLCGANLYRANLTDAILTETGLEDTNLVGCVMPDGSVHSTAEISDNPLERFKRLAWKPIVKEGDGDLRSSKFGGKPWLGADEGWPLCPNCDNPMRFFLQINLAEIPEAIRSKFGQGILQFFYCTYETTIEHDHSTPNTSVMSGNLQTGVVHYIEHQSCLDPSPFSHHRLIRIVQADGVSGVFEVPETVCQLADSSEGGFPPRRIVGWQQYDEYPGYADYENLRRADVSLSDDYDNYIQAVAESPEIDKLAGWPLWIQDVEYPACPTCQQPMNQLVFQLASDDNIPFLWGDVGIGYLLQCPEHTDQITFLSQCG